MFTKNKAIVMTRFPYESAFGGEESHTLRLAEYFQKKGYEVIFFGSCPKLLEAFQKNGFQVRKVWGGKMIVTFVELLKSFFLFPFMAWNMRRYFRKLLNDFHVKALYCLSFNEKIFLTAYALKKNIPVTWVEHQELRNWFLMNPWKLFYKKYASKVHIIPIGKKNTEVLQKSVPQKNCHSILHGIPLPDKHFFPKQKHLVLWANRLIPKKGWQDFLSSVEMLFSRYPSLEVMICGEGDDENALTHKLRKINLPEKISFFHFLKNEKLYELLKKVDIVVISSRDESETFSICAAEAMSYGCKLVVTSVCGIAQNLSHGKNAFIAKPSDPENLRRNIENALKSDNAISTNAMAFARKNFDEQRMFSEYSSIILRS